MIQCYKLKIAKVYNLFVYTKKVLLGMINVLYRICGIHKKRCKIMKDFTTTTIFYNCPNIPLVCGNI